MSEDREKRARGWTAVGISIGALLISAGAFLYSYFNTESNKQPWIEAVYQQDSDSGLSGEIISVTNRGGRIEGYHIDIRSTLALSVAKVSENGTIVGFLNHEPLYIEVAGCFDPPQYWLTRGDIIATVRARYPGKLSEICQDLPNFTSREHYYCVATPGYTLTVTYLSTGNIDYYEIPLNFGSAMRIVKDADIQRTRNMLNSASASVGSFTSSNNAFPTLDNLSVDLLWSWCKDQLISSTSNFMLNLASLPAVPTSYINKAIGNYLHNKL